MSIENAILELAAAIRELAKANAPQVRTEVRGDPALVAMRQEHEAAELETAVTQVETDAKAAQQKAMDKVSTGKAEIAAALEKAKAEKEAAKPAPAVEEDPLDAAPLDYEKDVKPKLVAVGKDKTQLVSLLAKFNAKSGQSIATADYPAIVAEADKILAARG